MAKAGRKQTPTKLKMLRGNPGRRPLPENEPEPEISKDVPAPPDHLTPEAVKEWKRISPVLHAMGVLTTADDQALAAYCECVAEWLKAKRKVAEHGQLVKTQTGYPNYSPWYVIKNAMQKEMRAWMSEFGMTPSSRTGVTKAGKKDKKPKGFGALRA